jgi:hypothetical protein
LAAGLPGIAFIFAILLQGADAPVPATAPSLEVLAEPATLIAFNTLARKLRIPAGAAAALRDS